MARREIEGGLWGIRSSAFGGNIEKMARLDKAEARLAGSHIDTKLSTSFDSKFTFIVSESK